MIYRSLTLALLICFFAWPAAGQHTAVSESQTAGHIRGIVFDRDTGEPLGFVYLHLEEASRTATARADGTFRILNVPPGSYTLTAYRIGYRTQSRQVDIPDSDTLRIELTLQVSPLSAGSVEVTGDRGRAEGSGIAHASRRLYGSELRKNLGATLAETMEDLPGLSSRSMGSAPSRPVLRGLGGERLLILQDGERTGDVSSQSADHAVTVDPMAAEQIEIARGPSALAYGSNAIGGVVNVVRNQISPELPDGFFGTLSLQGETVNRGRASGLEASFPLGNFSVQVDANLRGTSNVRTPEGTLSNSGLLTSSNALGVSLVRPWGYAGGAGSVYLSRYGIPPDPNGGHPDGVHIEMHKMQLDGRGERFMDERFFHTLEWNVSHKNYYHREIESGGGIGTEFGLLTTNFSGELRHGSHGLLEEGSIGLWGEQRDYAVNGTNTPNSVSSALSAYWIETARTGSLHWDAGLRADYVHTYPEEENTGSAIGHIRSRSFAALASSLSLTWHAADHWQLGGVFMHSFRAPSQEELYSEGPHLASYSFEVGNPDLEAERGMGSELFLRYEMNATSADLSLYHNRFPNYIYPRNTGRQSSRFPTLDVYQFTGVPARFTGAEFGFETPLSPRLALRASAGYTFARREADAAGEPHGGNEHWTPLPMIPPLKGSLELRYAAGGFQAALRTDVANRQDRTGEFETATDGYLLVGGSLQYLFDTSGLLHALSLDVDNLLNTAYHSHLSRIKELVPEPGRNVSLLYRVYF
ncbi:MAG: TonB-dependent receptor [Balneolaceae bacterium]|nr:TonB-dependent receptor [Balneolaceae bacterium]